MKIKETSDDSAYKGEARFGKTTIAPRQRIARPIRMCGGVATRNSASHERPRQDWITIAVPPIVSEQTFALAQERLQANKIHAPRRTVTASVVQGLVSCTKCGYALYRTSTRSSARTIHYYRCLGSDAWRRFSGSICNNRPVRQDLLDEVVWMEIVRLLEDPRLIQNEIERRLAAAREADPTKRRDEALRRDLVRIRKDIDRLPPLIRKVFFRSKSCASACRSCDDANRRALPDCRRSLISPSPVQPICASLKR